MKSAIFAATMILTTLATIGSVEAGYLKLTPGELVQQSESEYALTINLENHDVSALMYGWQLVCEIVPRTPESTGLHFLGVARPANYVFGMDSWGLGTSDYSTPTYIYVVDVAHSAVAVPASGSAILQVGLDASQAVGLFDLVMIPELETGSYWLSDNWDSYAWDVNGSSSSILTTLAFPVPEPSFLALAMPVVAAVGIVLVRRRRSSHVGQ